MNRYWSIVLMLFISSCFNRDLSDDLLISSKTNVRPINSSDSEIIYFENGTCKCPNASVGDTAIINGTKYTVVDNTTIIDQIAIDNVNLCTTLVTLMKALFRTNTSFDSDISFWDTSNVTGMRSMFYGASSFNQPIGNWDVSNVTGMTFMFMEATSFNQDISNWNTSNLIDMGCLLYTSPSPRD